jgi:hypothetical protein
MNTVVLGMMVAVLPFAGASAGCSGGGCDAERVACDGPPPQMRLLDVGRGCLGPVEQVTGVCHTLVNRCTPSGAIAPACAVSPDGGVFVAIMTDNDMLTGAGWHFIEAVASFPDPAAIPTDEEATGEQAQECARALCAPQCSGGGPLEYASLFCESDAGEAGD